MNWSHVWPNHFRFQTESLIRGSGILTWYQYLSLPNQTLCSRMPSSLSSKSLKKMRKKLESYTGYSITWRRWDRSSCPRAGSGAGPGAGAQYSAEKWNDFAFLKLTFLSEKMSKFQLFLRRSGGIFSHAWLMAFSREMARMLSRISIRFCFLRVWIPT